MQWIIHNKVILKQFNLLCQDIIAFGFKKLKAS